jgi:hypothetical protein
MEFAQYDFLDFGCSDGGSLKFVARSFPEKKGLGIDISPRKVARAQEAGFEAVCMDVGDLQHTPNCVSFVIMSHFLEHLQDFKMALKCVRAGLLAARDFVIIRQPWFDSDGYLFRSRLKFYWSDWTGHTFKITCIDLVRLMRESGIDCNYRVYGRLPVKGSSDQVIHSLESPTDQSAYDPAKHGVKTSMGFSPQNSVFCESLLIATKSTKYQMAFLESILPGHLLYDNKA